MALFNHDITLISYTCASVYVMWCGNKTETHSHTHACTVTEIEIPYIDTHIMLSEDCCRIPLRLRPKTLGTFVFKFYVFTPRVGMIFETMNNIIRTPHTYLRKYQSRPSESLGIDDGRTTNVL